MLGLCLVGSVCALKLPHPSMKRNSFSWLRDPNKPVPKVFNLFLDFMYMEGIDVGKVLLQAGLLGHDIHHGERVLHIREEPGSLQHLTLQASLSSFLYTGGR